MAQLPLLSSNANLRGKRILLRVDWNIPLQLHPGEGELMKIERSAATIKNLTKREAVVIVMTHLGRPEGWEKKFSTAQLLPFAETYLEQPVIFCGEDLTTADGLTDIQRSIDAAKPGSVILLENVRFYTGEESNDKKLALTYATLGDIFMNDAFASCHRAHVSVAGIASYLPRYAGPQLAQEVAAADKLIHKPKHPFVAIVGGAKLSTKMPVIESLLKVADKVCIGGAMANPFFAAQRIKLGKSLVEEGSVKLAKPLIKHPKIILPTDVLVAEKLDDKAHPHAVPVKAVGAGESIGDIGPETMQCWSALIKTAQTILWNGPVGVTEIPAFSHGSLVIGKAMAERSAGKAYGVVGGGDTVPVAIATGMSEWYDHISMGGGALLEYIAEKGKLPGILALLKQQTSNSKQQKSPNHGSRSTRRITKSSKKIVVKKKLIKKRR